jgi:dTDP-4-amino-4,6-dideoxygalactose transaminase
VLQVKLGHIEQWTEARRALAARYREALADLPIGLPMEANGRRHVWHLFVAHHAQRGRIRIELEQRRIHTGLHYPVPVHLQRAYAFLGHQRGDFPVAERVARECLTLPLYPEMTLTQQDQVILALREILAEVDGK